MSKEELCSIKNSTLDAIHLTQVTVYVPMLFLGVILNALALRVFCCKLDKWTATRVHMTHLVISDCFLLFTLPFKIISKEKKLDTLCLVLESAYFINRYMSIFLITIMAVDRYIAIKYPLKAWNIRSPLKSAAVCGFFWVLIITIICTTKQYENRAENGTCFKKVTTEPSMNAFATVIWAFVIPLTILSFCSIQITKKLMRKKSTHSHEKKLIQKSINIIFANMAVFIICFLPLHVAYMVRFIADSSNATCNTIEQIDLFLNLGGILANTNCCLDAICYYLVSKEFQEASNVLAYFSAQNKDATNQDSEMI